MNKKEETIDLLLQHLSGTPNETGERLLDDLRRRQWVETQRPLKDMQRRIEAARRPAVRLRRRWLAAACAALLLTVGGSLLWFQSQKPTSEPLQAQMLIQPGCQQALIALADGSVRQVCSMGEVRQVLMNEPRQAGVSAPVRQPLDLTVPRGGEFRIVLEDSTEVWLNAESRLLCDAAFGETERRVIVEGEAYFKVKKDAERPFLVESRGQTVRVYGTEFNVRSYSDDAVRTTLVEGSIALLCAGAPGELLLSPGQQAVMTDGEAAVRKVNAAVVSSWREGRFVFEDQSLEQIIADLSRWYDFSYDFTDDTLRGIVFSLFRNSE